MLTPEELNDLLLRNARVTYYVGHLARDVDRLTPKTAALRALKAEVMRLTAAGKIAPVQRRLNETVYEYIAVRLPTYT